MAWRIVKQPNGLLARFSDVVDTFTDMNMNERQAYRLCREDIGVQESKRKVCAGKLDFIPWTNTPSEDGLARWRDCLETIEAIHGKDKVAEACEVAKYPS